MFVRGFCMHQQKGWVGQGEVGGVICRVLCTWQLLGLAIKGPWSVPGMPTHVWVLNGRLPTENADHCMLVTE